MHLEKMAAGTYASKPLECRICVCIVLNSKNENMHVIGVINPKIYSYRNNGAGVCAEKALLSPPL
jgi:hypothetical protein